MYKLIGIFNVKRENNKIKSADYKIIHEFEEFDYSKKTKSMLISICKNQKVPYGSYSIVEYKGNEPVLAVAQLFYYPEDSWMDMAEWDERVVASVALGNDVVMSKKTKEE